MLPTVLPPVGSPGPGDPASGAPCPLPLVAATEITGRGSQTPSSHSVLKPSRGCPVSPESSPGSSGGLCVIPRLRRPLWHVPSAPNPLPHSPYLSPLRLCPIRQLRGRDLWSCSLLRPQCGHSGRHTVGALEAVGVVTEVAEGPEAACGRRMCSRVPVITLLMQPALSLDTLHHCGRENPPQSARSGGLGCCC